MPEVFTYSDGRVPICLHDEPRRSPVRAGTRVNYIMGGMFGAIGAMATLAQRERTGRGQEVHSALFENNVFLFVQHMMQFAVTGNAAVPMPSRISAWAVYDVFSVKKGEPILLAVVSDTQWAIFCDAVGLADLRADARIATNNQRVQARHSLLPQLRKHMEHSAPPRSARSSSAADGHIVDYEAARPV